MERIGNGTKNEEDELNRKAFIPISALLGALLLALVAAMNPFIAGPDRAYAQSTSTDTTLFQMSITGQGGETPTVSAFMPKFVPGVAPAEDGYTAYATNAVGTGGSVTLTATASHSGASVAVKAGATEAAAKAATAIEAETNGTFIVNTAAGFQGDDDETVILITVTAADDVAMDTYMVTVVAGAANSNVVTLSALSLMAGGDEITIVDTDTTNPFRGRRLRNSWSMFSARS